MVGLGYDPLFRQLEMVRMFEAHLYLWFAKEIWTDEEEKSVSSSLLLMLTVSSYLFSRGRSAIEGMTNMSILLKANGNQQKPKFDWQRWSGWWLRIPKPVETNQPSAFLWATPELQLDRLVSGEPVSYNIFLTQGVWNLIRHWFFWRNLENEYSFKIHSCNWHKGARVLLCYSC